MPILTALILYPIKSCAGISLQTATLLETGLAIGATADREWMVVDEAGNFLTQRELPALATVRPSLTPAGFKVVAPGMAPLQVSNELPASPVTEQSEVCIWNDRLAAIDCGDEAALWFSTALASPCRLVRFDRSRRRLADPAWSAGQEVGTLFSDGFPVLVISEASLLDLNERLLAQGRPALPMERFRPNVVIGGIDAHEEDYAATLAIGDAVLKPTKPCPRCAIPSIDQQTGLAGANPLDILQGYRAMERIGGGVAFGVNAIVSAGAGATLQVGQEVNVELDF